jgi:hypothetical protein
VIHDHALGRMSWRPKHARTGHRKAISIVSAVALAGAVCAGIANAALTSPAEGAVYRAGPVPITENLGGQYYQGASPSTTQMTTTQKLTCQFRSGTFPNARPAVTIIDVIRVADNVNVYHAEKPNNFTGATAAVLNDQGGPWTTSWAIPENAPAGLYKIQSSAINQRRLSILSPCNAETVVLDSKTIEYRPWQRVFKDLLGNGQVNVNIGPPSEFQAIVGSQIGQIYTGTSSTMQFFQLPGAGPIMLPADPAACAADPNSCLPSTAVQCTPGVGTCNPRLLLINKGAPGDTVQGLFDLTNGVFIAYVNVNGSQRLMFSLGSGDAQYRNLLNQLEDAAAAQGIDLGALLRTVVRVRLGANEYKLSLINGLQIDPKGASLADGVQIVTDPAVQAGLILNIFAYLGGPACVTQAGDSDPASPAPDRFTPTADAGYTVEKSDLLPEVPRVGAAGALVGGPIYHIEGDFVGAGTPLVNTSMAVIGVDTAEDEPNGYPIWVEPFLSTPTHVEVARTMDFIGTATWSASETNLGALGCLVVDFMLGAGVAIYNNPLPVGFGDIPIWDPQSAEVQALMAQVNAAVQDTINQVVANPTVADLLAQITGALPPVEGVPVP